MSGNPKTRNPRQQDINMQIQTITVMIAWSNSVIVDIWTWYLDGHHAQ